MVGYVSTMDLLEAFVSDCRQALGSPDPGAAVEATMRPLMAAPDRLDAIIESRRAKPGAAVVVHRSDDLTVMALEVPAGFVSPPHNHTVWAVVGIYRGAEDNVFYDRTADGIAETGRAVLPSGGCLALGPSAVHAIANSGDGPMRALHVYGGDLFATSRSEWDLETGEERPFGSSR